MKTGKAVKKIVKGTFFVLFAAFFIFLVLRIFIMDDNAVLDEVYPTDNFTGAYAELGDGAFSCTGSSSAQLSSDGYYSAFGAVYCESRKELQLTAKFNDSLLERYMPGADPESFRWELYDRDGNLISEGESVQSAERYQYNFRRLIFENVTLETGKDVLLRLVCDDEGYPEEGKEPVCMVIDGERSLVKYKLSGKEKTLLGEN